MEILVNWGDKPDEKMVNRTLEQLRDRDGVKSVKYENGSVLVEATLSSFDVVKQIEDITSHRAVLQGFGDGLSAVSMLNGGGVMGVVRFQQVDGDSVIIDGTVDGLTAGDHGLHIHEAGDISEGCRSIGDHLDLMQSGRHGSPEHDASSRHTGDLGNITAGEDGRAKFTIIDKLIKVQDIIGRSLAVSQHRDDLGCGGTERSHIDGNSGESVACGVIARSSGIFGNTKRVCACDGVVVWEERNSPLAGGDRNKNAGKSCCESHL